LFNKTKNSSDPSASAVHPLEFISTDLIYTRHDCTVYLMIQNAEIRVYIARTYFYYSYWLFHKCDVQKRTRF